jgi:hypothetical protein
LTGDDLTGDYSAIYPSSFIGSFTKGSKRGFILNDCEVLGLSSFLRKVEPESKEFALIIDLSLPLYDRFIIFNFSPKAIILDL